jgi:hypothetical protein
MDKNQTPLELGDFVCPRYYTEVPATAIEQAYVYQVVGVENNKIVAEKVSDPTEQIVASEDFFISLE